MGCGCKNSLLNGGRKTYMRKQKQKRSLQQQKSKRRLFSRKKKTKHGKTIKKMRGGSLNLIGTHPVSDLANITSKLTGYPYINSSNLFSSPYTAPNSYVV
jgi:hypothetical protein